MNVRFFGPLRVLVAPRACLCAQYAYAVDM
jgi:hypothetical protein